MKCIVRGCRNKLDETGRPVDYCDYQQGRCPMQGRRTPLSRSQERLLLAIVTLTAALIMWLSGWAY